MGGGIKKRGDDERRSNEAYNLEEADESPFYDDFGCRITYSLGQFFENEKGQRLPGTRPQHLGGCGDHLKNML